MSNAIKIVDLFSGIGGISLGLERTGGFKTACFCEIDSYAQKLLTKHWPDVPLYEDVKELTNERLRSDGVIRDGDRTIITAGFPCTDISHAGKGAGITKDTRSGLWFEVARLAGDIRPDYVLLENVAAILGRGIDTVLGDLAQIGYDCEWHCVPASAIGAPHRRDRWWAVCYPHADRRMERPQQERQHKGAENHPGICADVAYPNNAGNRAPGRGVDPQRAPQDEGRQELAQPEPGGRREAGLWGARFQWRCTDWQAEPNVGRVANGIPNRVDRLRCLGNSVVPQIPERIGRAILHGH